MISLDNLTHALQELVANERKGLPRVHLPARINISELKLSPEIDRFLEERRIYFESTKYVSIGVY